MRMQYEEGSPYQKEEKKYIHRVFVPNKEI